MLSAAPVEQEEQEKKKNKNKQYTVPDLEQAEQEINSSSSSNLFLSDCLQTSHLTFSTSGSAAFCKTQPQLTYNIMRPLAQRNSSVVTTRHIHN